MIAFNENYKKTGADVYLYPCCSDQLPKAQTSFDIWFSPARATYEKAMHHKKIILGRMAITNVENVYIAYMPIRRKVTHKPQFEDIEKCLFSLSQRLKDKNFYIAFPIDHPDFSKDVVKYAINLFKKHSCTLILCKL